MFEFQFVRSIDANLMNDQAEQARQLFRQTHLRGKLSKIWSNLTGSPGQMLELAEITSRETITSRHYGGLQVVCIRQIQGSQGRTGDFDRHFNPLQKHTESRWVNVALATLKGVSLPPVSLVQVGETYFVQDGHHRVSVAQALGQDYIDAEVIVWEIAGKSAPSEDSNSLCCFEPVLPNCACAG